jgi:hypothetical protein
VDVREETTLTLVCFVGTSQDSESEFERTPPMAVSLVISVDSDCQDKQMRNIDVPADTHDGDNLAMFVESEQQ